MYKRALFLAYIASILFIFLTSRATTPSYAHPGRTASDGCHYCRTNCDDWGVAWNARHCHGGSTPSYQAQPVVNQIPKCPTNSIRVDGADTCTCLQGYCPFIPGNQCYKLPSNAHCIISQTDSWECDDGYEEVNESCLSITVKPTPIVAAQDLAPPIDSFVQDENQTPDQYKNDLNEVAIDGDTATETKTETEDDNTTTLPALGLLSAILVGSGLVYMFKKK